MSFEDDISLSDTEFNLFRKLIHSICGISLGNTKKPLIQSRLQKRLRHYNLASYQAYYDLLIGLPEGDDELTMLINCMTTNKTDFFREQHHFDFIADRFVPALVNRVMRGQAPRKLRVWHAGCSTGEEPYTLAMVLRETLPSPDSWDIRLLASDIDTNVLKHAESGIYEKSRLETVPDELVRRYFLSGHGERSEFIRAKDCLRDMIAFRQINLLEGDWPIRSDVRFDILFCRNVVIYFDKPTQQRLFARFAERVVPGGYLFIGHSESLFNISDAFTSLGNTVYQLPDVSDPEVKKAA